MKKGDDIIISKINEINNGHTLELKIVVKKMLGGKEVISERKFIKSYWMEEI
ncbi:hypothetical protein JCM1393_27990 [Clostridium carnis]